VADRAAAVFEELLERPRSFRPGWPSRPRLALVGAPPELVAACEALAACDLLTSSEALSPGTYARRLDALRGGYDAVVAWAPGLEVPLPEAMGQLGAAWPGQALAVLSATAEGGEEAALSKAAPSKAGRAQGRPKTVTAGSGWDETAQRIVDAARAPCP
jgi:hypothetical protein